ncbi:hypothetical protein Cgig2_019987 [Carnegiea gigantea]|uniref:Uncharacterized protein n=1 Tax=Carnegiea gigantea TaxID=171969 RepID=A0A9Q1KDQ7_9CARY|nr:hypothetical protein Cgig2_019987 [Carnegiea gigantea]
MAFFRSGEEEKALKVKEMEWKERKLEVDVDVTKPLCRGIRVMVQGNPIWISFKLVELPEFYYRYGKLGHTLKDCVTVDPSLDEALLQYGKCFRDSPIKSLRSCTKLRFDNEYSSSGDVPVNTKGLTPITPDSMVLDKVLTISPSTDAFKQKLQDRGKSVISDRKVQLVKSNNSTSSDPTIPIAEVGPTRSYECPMLKLQRALRQFLISVTFYGDIHQV